MKKFKLFLILLLLPFLGMAQLTDTQLTTQSNVIRNETSPSGNTKGRIADMFQALINSKQSIINQYTVSGTDTYTVTVGSYVTSYGAQFFLLKFTNANGGGATLNVNGLGAKNLIKQDGNPLSADDIKSGGVYWVAYDGTNFQIMLGLGTGGGGGGTPTWGTIVGDIEDQIDLSTILVDKASLGSPTFTGSPKAPTKAISDNSTNIASTAFVNDFVTDALSTFSPVWGTLAGSIADQTDLQNALDLKADLASPALTGVPTSTTATPGTNTTQIATTAFVTDAVSSIDLTSLQQKTVSGTTYTVTDADDDYIIYFSNSGAITVTLDDAVTANKSISFYRNVGAGVITFVSDGTSVLNSLGGVTIDYEKGIATWVKKNSTDYSGFGVLGAGGGGSSGTVTTVSVVTANGVSGSVATATTTPAITLALGAITPTSVNGVTVSGSSTPTLAVTGTTAVSGTNTGDQTISVTGDVTASGSTGSLTTTVTKINGVALSGLATGILKNTTSTGIPSIAVAADFPTLNQNTTGSAAKWTTPRNVNGIALDGTANITINANPTDGDKGDITIGSTGTDYQIDANTVGATELQTLTSSDLAGKLSDETGTGTVVFSASPALTGTPTAPTAAPGTSTTQIASTAFVAAAVTGGSVADGDKGDITVSGSGSTWTVDNDAVTYAKIQNVSATSKILGRVTAGAGDIEELTGAQATSLLSNAAADGSTKGVASFTAADFDATSGNIAIDYTNGQAASGSQKGFLTSADWTTFNNKLSSSASWLTASGGTLSAANTITANTANWLNFGGTITTTASLQYHTLFNPSLTADAINRVVSAVKIAPSLSTGAFSGVDLRALDISGGAVVIKGFSNVADRNTQMTDNSNSSLFEMFNDGGARWGNAGSRTVTGAGSSAGLAKTSGGFYIATIPADGGVYVNYAFSATTGSPKTFQLGGSFTSASGSHTYVQLENIPTLNSAASSSTYIGYRYNPTITSYSGTHYSFVSVPVINGGVGSSAPNSTWQVNGSFSTAYVAKTANYTLTGSDRIVECTANSFTITLPTAVGVTGREYVIDNSGVGIITMATTSSQTIDGAVPGTVAAGTKLRVYSNGANWRTY